MDSRKNLTPKLWANHAPKLRYAATSQHPAPHDESRPTVAGGNFFKSCSSNSPIRLRD